MTTTNGEPKENSGSARAWELLVQKLNELSADLRQERQATGQAQSALWKRIDRLADCVRALEVKQAQLEAGLRHAPGPVNLLAVLKWLALIALGVAIIILAITNPGAIPLLFKAMK